jgi:hypothetical protein
VTTEPDTVIFVLDRLVDCFFIIDICLNFFTGGTVNGKVRARPYIGL